MSRYTQPNSPALQYEELRKRLLKSDPEAAQLLKTLYETAYVDAFNAGKMAGIEEMEDKFNEDSNDSSWGV